MVLDFRLTFHSLKNLRVVTMCLKQNFAKVEGET